MSRRCSLSAPARPTTWARRLLRSTRFAKKSCAPYPVRSRPFNLTQNAQTIHLVEVRLRFTFKRPRFRRSILPRSRRLGRRPSAFLSRAALFTSESRVSFVPFGVPAAAAVCPNICHDRDSSFSQSASASLPDGDFLGVCWCEGDLATEVQGSAVSGVGRGSRLRQQSIALDASQHPAEHKVMEREHRVPIDQTEQPAGSEQGCLVEDALAFVTWFYSEVEQRVTR